MSWLLFSGVALDQVWFRHVGNNLKVSIIGTGDKLALAQRPPWAN